MALRHHPEKFVSGIAEPWTWQKEVLAYLGNHLRTTPYAPCRIAIASGTDIGKSALLAWIIAWGLSTYPLTRILVTANTERQIRTKLLPEVLKWFNRLPNYSWWDVAVTAIKIRDHKNRENWQCEFTPWDATNTAAFRGLHNRGKRVIILYDEASNIHPDVWDTAERGLTDEKTESIFIAMSNPSRNSGRFFECFHVLKGLWRTWQIDARTVEGANKATLEQWKEHYGGEDNDWYRIWVKGEFPQAAFNQLVSSELVQKCRKYRAEGYETLAKVISVDVAGFGDDQNVIFLLHGNKATLLEKMRNLDTEQVAERVIPHIKREKPNATVVDGNGIGAGVVAHLRARGHEVINFNGAERARDEHRFFNRRAEAWGLLTDGMREGIEIPDLPELEADLTGPEYSYNSKQQIQLERKETMKARGLASPDLGDALAMAWHTALQIEPQSKSQATEEFVRRITEPLSLWRKGTPHAWMR